MGMTFTNGSITSTSSEQNLFDVTGNAVYITSISTNAMTGSDTIVIKLYYLDKTGSTMRLYDQVTITGSQTEPLKYIDAIACRQYKVTLQRTGGSDRTYNWDRVEIT